jgi:hypothetical protein
MPFVELVSPGTHCRFSVARRCCASSRRDAEMDSGYA